MIVTSAELSTLPLLTLAFKVESNSPEDDFYIKKFYENFAEISGLETSLTNLDKTEGVYKININFSRKVNAIHLIKWMGKIIYNKTSTLDKDQQKCVHIVKGIQEKLLAVEVS